MSEPLIKHSLREEISHALSHGLGAALAAAGFAFLVTLPATQEDIWRLTSFSIYGTTLVILYLSSTVYHWVRSETLKPLFQLFDHVAIFLLIAGTYTPFTLLTLRGPMGWTLFGLIWSMATIGILLTIRFRRFKRLRVVVYLVMGWSALIGIKPLIENLPLAGLCWLAAGGLFYTVGVVFYKWHRLPYHHLIWHLFVLAGSASHFICILFYV